MLACITMCLQSHIRQSEAKFGFVVEHHGVRIFTLCQHSWQDLLCCRYLTHKRSMCAGIQYVLYVLYACAHTCTVYRCFPACVYVSPAVYLSLTVHWAGIQQLLPAGPEPAWWPPPLSKPELAHWWPLLSKKQKVGLDRITPGICCWSGLQKRESCASWTLFNRHDPCISLSVFHTHSKGWSGIQNAG